ncbi:MAG: C25 family cysteine peptidase [Planctomycetes bacterium]|nr:C25 family cysteine peptidase [Planctomycetota bacterium]
MPSVLFHKALTNLLTRAPNGTRALLCILALVLGATAYGATKTWTGGAGNNNFNTAGNWSPSGVPGSGDDVVFNGVSPGDVTITSSLTIKSLTFSGTTNVRLIVSAGVTLTVTTNLVVKNDSNIFGIGGAGTINVLGTFTTENNTEFTMLAGSTVNVNVSGTVDFKNNTVVRFNGGVFTVGTAANPKDLIFENNAHLYVDGGTVNVYGNLGGVNNAIADLTSGAVNVGSYSTKNGSVINDPNGILPVTFEDLRARAADGQVLVEWRVAGEVENAGFHVWRRPAGGSGWAWERANDALIAGRLTSPEPKSYSFLDRPEAGLWEYRIESVALSDDREFFTTNEAVAWAGDGLADETLEPAELAVPFGERLRSEARAERSAALGRAATPEELAALPPARKSPSADSAIRQDDPAAGALARGAKKAVTGDAAKAVYSGRGVLLVPAEALPEGFDAAHARIYRGGAAVRALGIVDGGVALYAPGYADRYTENDAFFLYPNRGKTSAQKAQGARGLFKDGVIAQGEETNTVTERYEDVYFNWSKQPLTYQPWISSKFLTQSGTETGLQSFTLTLPNMAAGEASLQATVYGHSDDDDELGDDHALQVFVNGSPAGSVTWEAKDGKLTFTFPGLGGLFVAGENTVELRTPPLDGIASQLAFVYSLAATYPMALQGPGPLVIDGSADGSSSRVYEVTGLATGELWVVDARRPEKANLVPYETRDDGGSYTARFKVRGGKWGEGDGILVVPRGEELAPLAVSARSVSRLPKGIGYLATGPAQFGEGLQPLLAQRAAEGLEPAFAEQESLFDAYNFGRYGPDGIRNAVLDAKPRFLLLAGRTHWDYLGRENSGIDPLCPTFLEATARFGETACDARFGDLGKGYAEVAVGRFPVNNTSELAVLVQRTLGHVAAAGSNGTRGLAVGDTADGFNVFSSQAAHIVEGVPEIEWTRANLGSTEYPDAASITTAMQDAANGDADVILFVGHGSSSVLSKSKVLTVAKCPAWTGNAVLLQATCSANYTLHNFPGHYTNAGTLLTQAGGGIAASIGTTTYTNSVSGMYFMADLLGAAQRGSATWGEALAKAQAEAHKRGKTGKDKSEFDADLARTECLLGDPALPCAP